MINISPAAISIVRRDGQTLCLTAAFIAELFDGVFSNGLFTVDNKNGKITMNPGVYVLQKQINFGINDDTKIDDVFCELLGDVNSDAATDHCFAAHKHSPEVCMLRRGIKKKP